MKGLLFSIKRFTIHDGPGIRTTVFFKGCPLSCWWCHNPEGIQFSPEKSMRVDRLGGREFRREQIIGREWLVEELLELIERDRLFMDESGGGVTFSGGEPLMQPEFLEEIAAACRRSGIHTALDTCGHVHPEVFRSFTGNIDLFLYDIKLIDPVLHEKFTGVSNGLILENLRYLGSKEKNVIIRIPLIPGVNDGIENIEKTASLLTDYVPAAREISLLPYHDAAREKYDRMKIPARMKAVPPLREEDIRIIKVGFESLGYRVTIGM